MILDPAAHIKTQSATSTFIKRVARERESASQVDPAKEQRPARRARIVCVTVRQALIRLPHNGLKLGKLGEERRTTVVDLARVERNCARRFDSRVNQMSPAKP